MAGVCSSQIKVLPLNGDRPPGAVGKEIEESLAACDASASCAGIVVVVGKCASPDHVAVAVASMRRVRE